MTSAVFSGFIGFVVLFSFSKVFTWRRNYQAALTIGLPVYSSPIYFFDPWWQFLHPVLVPILERLPKTWTSPWLPLSQTWMIWKNGHQPFEEAGSDTIILATPNGNMLWSSDNVVIRQLLILHPKVEQPPEILDFWNIWGPTIGSTQGDEWKAHRKVVAKSFGYDANRAMWEEARHATETLLDHWVECESSIISVARTWTSKLALHVITAVFFDLRLSWETDRREKSVPAGHNLSFEDALCRMLRHLIMIYIVPRRLLGLIPGKMFKEAYSGLIETGRYLYELHAKTASNLDEVLTRTKRTWIETIVVAATDPMITGKSSLPEGSVPGNMFFTLFAGHETVGGSLGFILVLLAIYPESQQRLQDELDAQLSSRPSDEWTLDSDFLALQNGYTGAIQKEALYLYNPAVLITRKVVETITIHDSKGSKHVIPKETLVLINTPASARNPSVWHKPQVPAERRAELSDSPALYFNPDRWLEASYISKELESREPPWYPFGTGGRTCPGQRFAQVEMTSVMATLFKTHSLQLIVDDQTRKECQGDETLAWNKTRDRAIKMLYDDIESNMSISLRKDLPIRVVPRHSQLVSIA